MNRRRKLLQSLLVLGVVGTLAGAGAFSAFSSTTANDGNGFRAGTVNLTDNDAGAVLYNVGTTLPGAKPGDSASKCIKVTYNGTLPANVALYTTSAASGALDPYLNMTVQVGTQATSTFADCTGFTQVGSDLYSGTTSGFFAKNSFANGSTLNNAAGSATWSSGNAVVVRVSVSLADNNGANQGNAPGYVAGTLGYASGLDNFTWEARNI